MTEQKAQERGTISTESGIGEDVLKTVEDIKTTVPELSPIFDKVVATFSTPYSGPRPACLDALIAGSQALEAGCPPKLLANGYIQFTADVKDMSREDLEMLCFAFMTQYNTEVNAARASGFPAHLKELIEKAAADGKLNVITDNETAAHLRGEGVDLGAEASKETLN